MRNSFRRIIASCLVLTGILSASCVQSDNSHECACSEIGIDSVWADSSQVACYRIPVTETDNEKESERIYIAAIRAGRTGASTSAEPLLYLHGGPGIATLDNAERYLNSTHWRSLREHHDIVMLDYRGTGYSGPSLCADLQDSLKNFASTNPSREAYKAKELALYVMCRASLEEEGIDLQSFSSFQMAADADRVRESLGIEDWNLYGISYGSMVSLLYLRHFPEHIRSVVLDSPFPPNAPGFDFIQTMNSALVNIQGTLQKDSATAGVFPDVIGDFAKAAKRLNEKPARLNGMEFNGDLFANAMVGGFYKTEAIPLIPLALREFAVGNDSLLSAWMQALSDSEAYGRTYPVQGAAITCFECKPRTPEQTPDSLKKAFPHLASLSMGDYLDLCDVFRPERPDDKFFEPVKSDVPVLLVVGAYDPGTPPFFAEAAMESLTNSTLMVVPNASHAAMHASDCSFNTVKSFLVKPSERPDLSCLEKTPKMTFATTGLASELSKIIEKKNAKKRSD